VSSQGSDKVVFEKERGDQLSEFCAKVVALSYRKRCQFSSRKFFGILSSITELNRQFELVVVASAEMFTRSWRLCFEACQVCWGREGTYMVWYVSVLALMS
jgi:hypothetical protein